MRNATLVVWTKCGFLNIDLEPDNDYWEQSMLPKVKKFFESMVLPEILTGQLKKTLDSRDKSPITQEEKMETSASTSSKCDQYSSSMSSSSKFVDILQCTIIYWMNQAYGIICV